MALRRMFTVLGVATLMLGVVQAGGAAAPAGWSVSALATGLNAPRGVAVDGVGGVYVAEAGVVGTGDFGVTRTGAVDKYRWSGGGLTRQWSTPFTAIYAAEGGGAPDALGPAGISTTGTGCFHNARGVRRACQVQMIMSVNHDELLAQGGPNTPQVGHLYRLNSATGAAQDLADVGDQNYAWTALHKSLWEEFPDSNPYGVLVTKGAGKGVRTFVVDAGANTVSEILHDGTARVIAYIPNEAPPGVRDAAPTCVAAGPDGMLYVGALDLLVNLTVGNGHSNVWRVDPNSTNWQHNATLWATGLTTVSACTFDAAGNFWAAEMFYDNGAGAPPGDLARVPFANPTAIEHVGNGQLLLPGGVAVAGPRSLYVTTGAAAGNGQGGVALVTHG